jgi:hypothetical protein
VQAAGKRCRILAREGDAQRLGRAPRLARREHAADRRLALGKRALLRPAALSEGGGLRAHLPALGLKCRERAVRVRDGALGVAQRVARFPARFFLLLQLLRQRPDARPQCRQVFFFRGMSRRCGEGDGEEENPIQARAFPCADTAEMRFAISSASPR